MFLVKWLLKHWKRQMKCSYFMTYGTYYDYHFLKCHRWPQICHMHLHMQPVLVSWHRHVFHEESTQNRHHRYRIDARYWYRCIPNIKDLRQSERASSAFLPGDMRVLPLHIKISVPMSNSMVVCRYLQSWLTVAMKCRVMYSYSRQPSLPAGTAEDEKLRWKNINQGLRVRILEVVLICCVPFNPRKSEKLVLVTECKVRDTEQKLSRFFVKVSSKFGWNWSCVYCALIQSKHQHCQGPSWNCQLPLLYRSVFIILI